MSSHWLRELSAVPCEKERCLFSGLGSNLQCPVWDNVGLLVEEVECSAL